MILSCTSKLKKKNQNLFLTRIRKATKFNLKFLKIIYKEKKTCFLIQGCGSVLKDSYQMKTDLSNLNRQLSYILTYNGFKGVFLGKKKKTKEENENCMWVIKLRNYSTLFPFFSLMVCVVSHKTWKRRFFFSFFFSDHHLFYCNLIN